MSLCLRLAYSWPTPPTASQIHKFFPPSLPAGIFVNGERLLLTRVFISWSASLTRYLAAAVQGCLWERVNNLQNTLRGIHLYSMFMSIRPFHYIFIYLYRIECFAKRGRFRLNMRGIVTVGRRLNRFACREQSQWGVDRLLVESGNMVGGETTPPPHPERWRQPMCF